LVQPVQDTHQGRLARSVLAEQSVYFSSFHFKIDVIVGDHSGETLDDIAQFHF